MNTVIVERIDNAEETITLRIPKAWRGGTVHVEMSFEEEAHSREPDPDYNPDWRIGDTLHLVKNVEKLGDSWPEGLLAAMYGSAPDLVIDKPGPPSPRDIEWLD